MKALAFVAVLLCSSACFAQNPMGNALGWFPQQNYYVPQYRTPVYVAPVRSYAPQVYVRPAYLAPTYSYYSQANSTAIQFEMEETNRQLRRMNNTLEWNAIRGAR